MSCNFGESISKNGPTSFDKKFIQAQLEVASEELGDEFIEDKNLVSELAGEAVDILGEDYFSMRAQSIVRCLQARYLGDCTIKECVYKEKISELIEKTEISTLSA